MCWEIWKESCSCKYGGKRSLNKHMMTQHILWNIQSAMNKASLDITLDHILWKSSQNRTNCQMCIHLLVISYKWSVENEKHTRPFAHYLEEQPWQLWGKVIGSPQGVGFMRQKKFQPFFLENRLNYSLPDDWRKKTTQLQAQSHHREDLTYDNSSLRGANKVEDNLTKMENTNKNGHIFVSF